MIQARDPDTLEPLDFYYILFDSRASAAAYSLEVFRLWKLGKKAMWGPTAATTAALGPSSPFSSSSSSSSSFSSPVLEKLRKKTRARREKFDDGGEDPEPTLSSFTLVLPSQRHYLQLDDYPRSAYARRLRMQGAAPRGMSWVEALGARLLQQSPQPPPPQQQQQQQQQDASSPSPSSPSSSDSSSVATPPPPPPAPGAQNNKLFLVLLTVDGNSSGGDGLATPGALRHAIEEDGVERNLAWRVVGLGGDHGDGIKSSVRGVLPLGKGRSSQYSDQAVAAVLKKKTSNNTSTSTTNSNSSSSAGDGSSSGSGSGGSSNKAPPAATLPEDRKEVENVERKYRRYSRFVISFADEAEARRFVRCWHRRELVLRTGGQQQQDKNNKAPHWEESRVVNASVLW